MQMTAVTDVASLHSSRSPRFVPIADGRGHS